jgi:Zn-dependent peptidase ImmA (M78 family)
MNTMQVSTTLLQWAAQQRGLSMNELIDSLEVAASKRETVLSGQLTPHQIEKLSKKTNIPFGYFFLDEPPKNIYNSLPDLRQLLHPAPLSQDFFDTLNDILRKQQWYLDYLEEQDIEKLSFVGKFKFSSALPVSTIATDIRHTLNLTLDDQKNCKDAKNFYQLLSKQIESIGILVFKNGVVKNNNRRNLSVKEFRGFAIADHYAPVIFINGKDSETAWIFTLAHELAHIWLGESGVSDIPAEPIDMFHNRELETYCNQIAAELLLPERDFLTAWAAQPEILETQRKIEALSKIFKVSRWVVARRAYNLGKIRQDEYVATIQVTQKKSTEGGDFYRMLPVRNSKRLTQAIVNSAMSGKTMLREAASLLNVKPHTIIEMSKNLENS